MVVLPNCDTVFNHLVKLAFNGKYLVKSAFEYPVSIDFSYIAKIVFNFAATLFTTVSKSTSA